MTQREWQDKFRNKLISVMRDRNVGQNQLARRSGLSTSRISDYVNGRAVPSVYAIVNMAYALDVSTNELADFNERIAR